MTDRRTSDQSAERGAYWDTRYGQIGAEHVSWYQPVPHTSLELIDVLGVGPSAATIDVGGGASTLVDELVGRGFGDVTVLDVSSSALDIAAARLGNAGDVTWVHADVLTWTPTRRWDMWHDRAVFHFLAEPDDQDTYLRRMRDALAPGAAFLIATFAADGPDQCSGLPVTRYDATALVEKLRGGLGDVTIVEQRHETHTTPSGGTQAFTWIAGTTELS